MIWMLDTNILVYFANRKPGFEKIARRMSGRSPGEVRSSAITLARHIGAVLVSNNEREFRRVPGLSVQNWLKA